MLDRVLELGDGRASGFKNVTCNEPHFRGHFPGDPVMPGVLTLEGLFQLTQVLYLHEARERGLSQGLARLLGVDRMKFRLRVRPGDRLDLEVTEVAREGGGRTVRAEARVEGRVASEALLRVEVGPLDSPASKG